MDETKHRPLAGRRVVVTRPAADAGELVEALVRGGATAVAAPTIRVELQPGAVAAVLDRRYEWIVVTSVSGVRAVRAALDTDPSGATASVARAARVAAVGPATAAAARDAGFAVELVPDRALGAALVEAFPVPLSAGGDLVLLAQANRAGTDVADGLAAKGWTVVAVTAYRTVAEPFDPAVAQRLAGADAITFLSGSAASEFVAGYGRDRVPPVVACIGPSTAAVCRGLGLVGIVVAPEPTTAALVGLLGGVLADRPGPSPSR